MDALGQCLTQSKCSAYGPYPGPDQILFDQEEAAKGRTEGFFQGHGGIVEEASRL